MELVKSVFVGVTLDATVLEKIDLTRLIINAIDFLWLLSLTFLRMHLGHDKVDMQNDADLLSVIHHFHLHSLDE